MIRLLVAVLVFIGVAAQAAAEETTQILRVLCYNIHHGEGVDGKLDLERIARVIQSAKPDLVALQEVDQNTDRTNRVDQAALLGELTQMHAAFGKAMDYRGGAYGLAVLSRWPLSNVQTRALPADAGTEPRIVLQTQLRPAGANADISFLVTHVDHRADATQRMRQVQKIHELFSGADSTIPMILAGDLNATPDSEPLKTLLTSWKDSAAGQSYLTSPSTTPRRRIDYILYRPANRWRVLESRALDESVASDHRPVLSVLELLK